MSERLDLMTSEAFSNLNYSMICSFLFTVKIHNKKSLQNLYLGEPVYLGCVGVSCFSPSFSEKSRKVSGLESLPGDSCLSLSHGNGARNSRWHRPPSPTPMTSKSLPLAFALGQPAVEFPKKQLSFQRPDSYLEDTTKPTAALTLDCRDF